MLNMRACPRKQLSDQIDNKKIVCFGAGTAFMSFLDENRSIFDKILCVIDNDKEKNGMIVGGFQVYSVDEFVKQKNRNIVVVITSILYCEDIVKQLDEIEFFHGIDCYIDAWNKNKLEKSTYCLLKGKQKIPKTIHYCWFGKKKIPEYLQKCIDTWHKYCPDYEIIRWDESNYDYKKNKYMRQAYEMGKYGFVPDYARLDIVQQYGGIYLDTDVELIRSLNELLCYDFYCGFEDDYYVALGLGFGAVSEHPLLGRLLDAYSELDFVKNGKINNIASPYYQSIAMEKEGFILNGMYQEKQGIGILPHDAFAPGGSLLLPDEITKNTFSIHHYDASWMDNQISFKNRNGDLRRLYIERVCKESA